jgi:hypothetical protein
MFIVGAPKSSIAGARVPAGGNTLVIKACRWRNLLYQR